MELTLQVHELEACNVIFQLESEAWESIRGREKCKLDGWRDSGHCGWATEHGLAGYVLHISGNSILFFSVRAAKVSTGDSIIKAYVEVCNWQPWLYPFNDG